MTTELSLLSASIIVVSLITWCVLVISSGASHEQHEILADRFPVLFLSKNELEEASRRYTDALKRRSDRPETTRQVELLEEAVGKRLSAIVDDTPAELQHEFNQFAIQHFWPKWHAHLPLSVALIVAALHVTAVTWDSVIVLSLVVLPLPVVISFVIRMLVVIYEVRVNYILRIGKVPPRMVPDFYHQWESVKSNFNHR